jgi:hypothetical protein
MLVALLMLAMTDANAAAVEGYYRANGKDAPPAHALAHKGDAYMDKPTFKLILSQKDAAKDDRADFSAQMGDLGSALVITLVRGEEGYDVIGAQFAHPDLKRSGASSAGLVEARDIAVSDGEIHGRIVSVADAMLFDEPIEIDLEFQTKIP